MSKRSALLGILAAASFAGPAHAACSITQIAELPVKVQGLSLVIDAKINDQPVKLIADTGASSSTMIGSAADRLGLKQHQLDGVTFYGAGGDARAYYVDFDKLQIGKFSSTKSMRWIVLGRNQPIAKGSIDALLGADFFSQTDVEFDLAHNVIRMMRPKDCKEGEVVYWGGAYAMEKLVKSAAYTGINQENVVEVEVNGKTVKALMDTGASFSSIDSDAAKRFGVKEVENAQTRNAVGIGGSLIAMRTAMLDSFAFDQEQIRNARIQMSDDHEVKATSTASRIPRTIMNGPEMILGADFFVAHRIFFARSEGKVYISYNGGPLFQDPDDDREPVAAKDDPK